MSSGLARFFRAEGKQAKQRAELSWGGGVQVIKEISALKQSLSSLTSYKTMKISGHL
jgi:hypothetical protein